MQPGTTRVATVGLKPLMQREQLKVPKGQKIMEKSIRELEKGISKIALAYGISTSCAWSLVETIGYDDVIRGARIILTTEVRPFWVHKILKARGKWLRCFGVRF
jgi:hypothetical protein